MGEEFDWTSTRIDDMYPNAYILAEIGRVAIAAARVDQELALVLVALKGSMSFEELLKKSSGDLIKTVKQKNTEFFEGEMHEYANRVLDAVRGILDSRHSVMHSIWSTEDRKTLLSAEALRTIRSQEELDTLIRERGAAAQWRTFHPKAQAPGPQTLEELGQIRRELEEARGGLTTLRFTLASALFAGKPPGARRVVSPQDL
ncbi:hypothetical protein HH310_40965 [Actinoplanes sp. TBRC 11911]|uniref:hypothetical protein n=1 Tax=Actinoplanes sp. TBRC 11911 TaxID=2729386 RepID=UPI00145DC774|nr:hypothetical protein [Actinoplanes sp. TBRC 11911]NMO57526.1 hypothetical protein [Actinoplanes sp. TBRC 11911]